MVGSTAGANHTVFFLVLWNPSAMIGFSCRPEKVVCLIKVCSNAVAFLCSSSVDLLMKNCSFRHS